MKKTAKPTRKSAMAKIVQGEFLTDADRAALEGSKVYREWQERHAEIRRGFDAVPCRLSDDDFRWFVKWGGGCAERAVKHVACPLAVIAEALSAENKWVREAAVEVAFRRGLKFKIA